MALTTQNPVNIACPQEVWTLIASDSTEVRFKLAETRASYAVTYLQPGTGPPVYGDEPGPVAEKIQTLYFRLDVCSGVDLYCYVYKGRDGIVTRFACAEV